jgi:type IV secretion system protein VirB6
MPANVTTFLAYATAQDTALRKSMDAVINASLSAAVPALHWLAIIYIVITFATVAANAMTVNAFIGRTVRLSVVVTLISTSGFYVQHVRDLLFDQVPTEIASVVTGAPSLTSAAQQFDLVSMAADHIVADAQAKNTWFTANGIGNSVAAWFADIAINLLTSIMFGVWMLGRWLLAVGLCMGPWLLLFELFDRTRGWVSQWIGHLVGVLVFSLSSAVILQILLRGEMDLLRAVNNSASNVDEIIGQLFHVAGFVGAGALTMLAAPVTFAIGSGSAAGHGVAMAGGFGLMRRAASGGGGRAAQSPRPMAAEGRRGLRRA